MEIHYNRTFYLKEFKKELTMILPAQQLKAAPPFSPIIAQYGLNANEFCEKFNKESIIFPAGTPVATSIFYIPKEKNFKFCFRPFQLKFILQQFINFDEHYRIYNINYIDLYKTLLIKGAVLNDNNLPKILRNIFGTFKSYERPLMITGKYHQKQQDQNQDQDQEQQTQHQQEYQIIIEPKIQKDFWNTLTTKNGNTIK